MMRLHLRPHCSADIPMSVKTIGSWQAENDVKCKESIDKKVDWNEK